MLFTTQKSIGMVLLFALVGLVNQAVQAEPRVSRFGEYAGYSEPIYDSYERVSQYVTVQEGTADETRLAIDIYLPTQNGELFFDLLDKHGNPVTLPVIWTQTVYHRSMFKPDGTIHTWLDEQPWLTELLRHGYVVAVADVRGTGASFGSQYGPFDPAEIQDVFDMTEWLAAQPWCSGNVGMFGFSYMGITQLLGASAAPPSLKCIVPAMVMFSVYDYAYPGGVFESNFVQVWGMGKIIADLNLPPSLPVVPVDDDPEGALLAEAIEEHLANGNVWDMLSVLTYRDSVDGVYGEMIEFGRGPSNYIDALNEAMIPTYLFGGWQDSFLPEPFLWYANLEVSKKLTVGPWEHQGYDYEIHYIEHLRWYDYWLKGINNGIVNEEPIHYYTDGGEPNWRSTPSWPIENNIARTMFFHSGNTGTVDSSNDGFLRMFPGLNGTDEYVVNYSATTGYPTRWTASYEPAPAPYGYPDMTYNDEKGLTYTSVELPRDVEVTGHPIVDMWVSSTADDGDFYVYLEEIEGGGYSHYVTEGVLRASHRALTEPDGYDNLGLPYHRSFAEDIAPLGSTPARLVLDLMPISRVFKAGNRIRVTITCSDQGNRGTPELVSPPTVTIHRNITYPSRIVLPAVPRNP